MPGTLDSLTIGPKSDLRDTLNIQGIQYLEYSRYSKVSNTLNIQGIGYLEYSGYLISWIFKVSWIGPIVYNPYCQRTLCMRWMEPSSTNTSVLQLRSQSAIASHFGLGTELGGDGVTSYMDPKGAEKLTLRARRGLTPILSNIPKWIQHVSLFSNNTSVFDVFFEIAPMASLHIWKNICDLPKF